MSLLNYKSKINMDPISINHFNLLEDNENFNRFWGMSLIHKINKQFFSHHMKRKRQSHKEYCDLVEEGH